MKIQHVIKKHITVMALVAVILSPSMIWADLFYTPSQYNKVYNEKVALELELKSLTKQYRNEKANLEQAVRDLQATIDRLNSDIELLRKQNDKDKELADQRISELEKRTDILKKQGSQREAELIQENRDLQKRYEAELEKTRKECADEQEKYARQLNDLKKDYEDKIAGLRKEISNLSDELSELKRLNKMQKEELERMEAQADEFEKKLAEEIQKGEIRLKRFHDRFIINIDDRISFDSGSSMLKKEILPALKKIKEILLRYPENRIIVEGHTDNVPIRTSRFRNNWQLSTERALSVLEFLLQEKKLNPTRFSAAGYGEFNPIFPNDTANNRSLNRRVDIVVVPRLTESK